MKKETVFNEDFFDIDNQTAESAYFIGFILADGYIWNDTLNIILSQKDIYILQVFQKYIYKSGHDYPKVYSYTRKGKHPGQFYYACCVKVGNTKISKDLSLYGIIPRKTGKEAYPSVLKEEFKYNFLMGVYDGDGGFCQKIYNGTVDKKIQIASANAQFLHDLKANTFPSMGNIYHKKNQNCNVWQIGKTHELIKFRDTLYEKNPTIFIPRKKEVLWYIDESKMISAFNEKKTIAEWSRDKRCAVDYATLQVRFKTGKNPETSIVTPAGKLNEKIIPDNDMKFILDKKKEGKSIYWLCKNTKYKSYIIKKHLERYE